MLKVFRNNTKIIVWITVIALALLFGAGSIVDLVSGKKSGRFAGEAFGRSVSFQEYNQFYHASQLFMPVQKSADNPEILRDYTWQNIIYSREAKRDGIKVADEEVRDEIAKILKQQGLIGPTNEQYKIWLTRSLHMSPREFEEGLREFIRIQKLLRSKIQSFAVPGIDKMTDPKAKEAALEKQKLAFMAWTNEVNSRAALQDYLALPETQGEMPEAAEVPAKKSVPVSPSIPAAPSATSTAEK